VQRGRSSCLAQRLLDRDLQLVEELRIRRSMSSRIGRTAVTSRPASDEYQGSGLTKRIWLPSGSVMSIS
jgi:hypothetical protein